MTDRLFLLCSGGGADGSILVYREIELQDRSNAGLKKALDILEPYVEKYPKVSPGDMYACARSLGSSLLSYLT